MSNKFIRYDIEGFAQDMEVDLPTISSLYSEYFLEMKSNIEESFDFLKKNDWQMLQRRIHNMKGISVTLRVDDIYSIANGLEKNLKRGEYLHVDKGIFRILELLNSAEKDIKDFFHQNNISI
jgi:HPt (histidine-containing phosphotransfer) domain-containing protein